MPQTDVESPLSVALAVIIGLVFVFMLFSLFLSTVLEAVSALLKLRGRALRVAIAKLIDGPDQAPRFGGFGLIDDLWGLQKRLQKRNDMGSSETAMLIADPIDLAHLEAHEAASESADGEYVAQTSVRFTDVFHHALVAGATAGEKPSYVPATNFALALLHVLGGPGDRTSPKNTLRERTAALPPGQLRQALQAILQDAADDWEKVRVGIELWYDHAMKRLSGEYKRFSQLITFLLGLVLALWLNIDTVAIAQRLYLDPVLRGVITAEATAYVTSNKATGSADNTKPAVPAPKDGSAAPAKANFEASLKAATDARDKLLATVPFVAVDKDPQRWFDPSFIFGALLTALAGMLGAPFWFELLSKLVNLRGAGPKPVPPTTAPHPKAGQ